MIPLNPVLSTSLFITITILANPLLPGFKYLLTVPFSFYRYSNPRMIIASRFPMFNHRPPLSLSSSVLLRSISSLPRSDGFQGSRHVSRSCLPAGVILPERKKTLALPRESTRYCCWSKMLFLRFSTSSLFSNFHKTSFLFFCHSFIQEIPSILSLHRYSNLLASVLSCHPAST